MDGYVDGWMRKRCCCVGSGSGTDRRAEPSHHADFKHTHHQPTHPNTPNTPNTSTINPTHLLVGVEPHGPQLLGLERVDERLGVHEPPAGGVEEDGLYMCVYYWFDSFMLASGRSGPYGLCVGSIHSGVGTIGFYWSWSPPWIMYTMYTYIILPWASSWRGSRG